MKNKVERGEEPKPKLLAYLVEDTETNTVLYRFPPNRSGEKKANRFNGLSGIKIIKLWG